MAVVSWVSLFAVIMVVVQPGGGVPAGKSTVTAPAAKQNGTLLNSTTTMTTPTPTTTSTTTEASTSTATTELTTTKDPLGMFIPRESLRNTNVHLDVSNSTIVHENEEQHEDLVQFIVGLYELTKPFVEKWRQQKTVHNHWSTPTILHHEGQEENLQKDESKRVQKKSKKNEGGRIGMSRLTAVCMACFVLLIFLIIH